MDKRIKSVSIFVFIGVVMALSGVVFASTTISTDVTTGGNLTVSGSSLLSTTTISVLTVTGGCTGCGGPALAGSEGQIQYNSNSNFAASANLTYDGTVLRVATSSTRIGAPANVNVTQADGSGNLTANNYDWRFAVYAYYKVNGIEYVNPTPGYYNNGVAIKDNALGQSFHWNISWDAVTGADGYWLVQSMTTNPTGQTSRDVGNVTSTTYGSGEASSTGVFTAPTTFSGSQYFIQPAPAVISSSSIAAQSFIASDVNSTSTFAGPVIIGDLSSGRVGDLTSNDLPFDGREQLIVKSAGVPSTSYPMVTFAGTGRYTTTFFNRNPGLYTNGPIAILGNTAYPFASGCVFTSPFPSGFCDNMITIQPSASTSIAIAGTEGLPRALGGNDAFLQADNTSSNNIAGYANGTTTLEIDGYGDIFAKGSLTIGGSITSMPIHSYDLVVASSTARSIADAALVVTGAGNVGIGSSSPISQLDVANPSANATTTMTLGQGNSNKGSCLKLFRTDGSPIYASIASGASAFTLSTTPCATVTGF